MKLKVGKFEFEGTVEEILTFWIGYEIRDQFKNMLNDSMDDIMGGDEE